MFRRLAGRGQDKYRVLVSDEQRFAWFKVRKCGSSSIGDVLPGPFRDDTLRPSQVARYDDYFTFAFVRNPYGRLVSNYLNKIKDQKREDIRPGYIRNLDFREGMSFEEFANQVCDLPDEKCDRHYKSMHRVFPYERVDFIGRLESFVDDLSQVLERIQGAVPAVLPHKKNSGKQSYTEFYTDALRERVGERYRKDLEIFGYDFGA